MILTSGLSYRPCWIFQKSQKCLFEWSKEPNKWFLAIFLSYVHRIDFKLHILITLNDLDMWAVMSPKLDHSKITKCLFGWSKMPKKGFFDHFLELGLLDRLDTAYYDIRQRYQIKKSYALKASPPDIDLSFLIHFGYSINTFITLSITNRITAFISSSSGVHWSPCLLFRSFTFPFSGD